MSAGAGVSADAGLIAGAGLSAGTGAIAGVTGAGAVGEERTTVAAAARVDRTPLEPLEPERYKVQFTATEEYVRLVEEAKALLSHAVPNVALEELQIRAMRALVAALKTKKYTTSGTGESADVLRGVHGSPAPARDSETADALPRAASRTRGERTNTLDNHDHHDHQHTRRRGRHIPAAVRRAVFERDGNRCTYVEANGARCREAHRLEFHHLKPFAAGGDHHAANLTLRCAAHNALAAEEDFGRELIEDKKSSPEHELFAAFEMRSSGL
jgi:hypothetical protein